MADLQNIMAKMATLYTDDLFMNHISQIASKSILKELSNTETSSEIKWSYHEPYLQRNASSLTFLLEEIALTDTQYLNDVKNSSLRLALLWENLSRLKENTPKGLALLNSAMSYELAGYQANSSCLSKNFLKNDDIIKSPLEILIATFLQRLFIKLRVYSQEKIKPNYNDSESLQNLGLAVTSSGLINCSNFFLSGRFDELQAAKEKFQKAEEFYTKTKNYEASNLLRSLRSLIDVMKSKSTWFLLKDYTNNFLWERYLRLLARGLGSDIINSHSISELWPSQIESLNNGLLISDTSKIIRMPTSAGKTRIAELALIKALSHKPSAKCIYIAPYRALVSELEENFTSILSDLGFRVSSILGFYENDPFERKLINDSDLLITTPEKLDLLLRSKPEFFDNVSLIILDEGHVLNLGKRGIKIELLLTRLKKKLSTTRFLLLSAVLSEKTMQEFVQWFKIKNDDLIKLDWKPTIKQHAKFEWTKTTDVGRLSYVSRPENQLRRFYINSIIKHKKYSFKNPKTGRRKSVTFPSTDKHETAAELAFKYSQLGPVLIFAPTPRLVMAIGKALNRRLNLTKLVREDIPSHFQHHTSRSGKIAEEWLGKEHEITKLLKNGIGVHYGDLPDTLKRNIEIDFREKNFRVIVATTTLAQGVNFPIRTVILHSCRRYQDGRTIPLTSNDYWNLAGRVGRAGYETEGTVIHIVSTQTDEDDYNYYLKTQKDLEPIDGKLFHLLEQLIEGQISDNDLKYTIDPEILGILAEENSIDSYETEIDDILNNSLVSQQVKKYPNFSIDVLSSTFKKQAKNIILENNNPEIIKIYSNTGFSSSSCRIIHNFVSNNNETIKNLLTEDNFDNLIPLMKLIFEIFNEIQEINPRYPYYGDKIELLQLWLSGRNFSEIFEEIDDTNTYNITKFIEDYFGYYTPWGISAFLQISMKVLNIDENDLPSQIKYLPSMVKFGVPTAEVSWAMQLGIPFKDTAMGFAREYLKSTENPDYTEFVDWATKIEHEELVNEYNLSSPFLEDVSKSISRLNENKLLKEKRDLGSVLIETTWVRGIKYENRSITASQVKIDDMITLSRDYTNLYDRNAIKLFFKGRELGFIAKELAQYLAPIIDGGQNIQGKIINIKKDAIPQIEIKLNLS